MTRRSGVLQRCWHFAMPIRMSKNLVSVRRIAWAVLLLTGAGQAWVFRHAISPDGVAYLDLSDAVLSGRLADLVNGYWSPLYPALIGLLRLLLAPTSLAQPYWEFALVHVVNLLGLILSLVSFEWFLNALDDSGRRWGQCVLSTVSGRAIAYVLFGVIALVMISVGGTVPDLFLSAALFAAFAFLLRLRVNPLERATAIKLGIALALGALTKSIMFPLAVVMLATLGVVARRQGGIMSAARSLGVFLVLTLPWVLAVSRSVGRPSTGETGSLNFAWYVNHQQPPNTGTMPALASPRTIVPLEGLAVIPAARGTNPLWLDPARWHRDVRPRVDGAQIYARASSNLAYFLALLAPLVLVAVSVGAAMEWRDLRATLERSAVVVVPSLAAFAAYAMVYATSRYIAPFLVASCLTVAAAFPASAPLRIHRLVLAASLSILAIDALSPLRGRVFATYAVAVVALTWAAWGRFSPVTGARRWIYALISAAALLGLMTLVPIVLIRALTLVLGVGLWVWLSRDSVNPRTPDEMPLHKVLAVAGVAVFVVITVVTGWHAVARWDRAAGVAAQSHPDWTAARQLIDAGIRPGSKIAVLGNPENAGWARLARYQIVGVVPESQVAAFAQLNAADRQRVLSVFMQAGAVQMVRMPAP
jgi:hypothetical protein